jgi:hypothetical protein
LTQPTPLAAPRRGARRHRVLIGFKSEDDWFEYRLLNDPRFLKRIEAARKSVRAGRVTRIEEVEWQRPADRAAFRGAEHPHPELIFPDCLQ